MRYVLNGVVATAAHYAVLTINLEVIGIPSAGVANFVAAIFGIGVSFLGSRYYVFRKTDERIILQLIKFSGLYGFIAILHGCTLFLWTDWQGFDYRVGFIAATIIQVSLSYFGNKRLVFNI